MHPSLTLRERFRTPAAALSAPSAPAEPPPEPTAERYQAIKGRLHMKLVEQFDLAALEAMAPEVLRQEIGRLTERLLKDEPVSPDS
jgi:pilus assembly protein CpaF